MRKMNARHFQLLSLPFSFSLLFCLVFSTKPKGKRIEKREYLRTNKPIILCVCFTLQVSIIGLGFLFFHSLLSFLTLNPDHLHLSSFQVDKASEEDNILRFNSIPSQQVQSPCLDLKKCSCIYVCFARWKTNMPMTANQLQEEKIANTGQLCCVAARPHGAKSPSIGRDNSVDPGEPHWQTNSSFSPAPFRIWDCRFQSDGLQHGSHGAPLHGSSLSSASRGSRSRVSSERFTTNHHHSVSDGVLSYSGSPPDHIQAPRWTSPVQKFNLGDLAASTMGGSRSQTSWFTHSTERRYAVRPTAASPSLGSPSSLSESGQWESTSKQPFSFPNRNAPSRRSYMSKAVYPLVFHNPVSDCENFGDADTGSVGRLTPGEDHISPLHWLDNNSSIVQKFHKTITDLQRWESSPDPGASSRREGFRWSSASSYDFGLDGERFDMSEHIDVESLRSPIGHAVDQKCGVCRKLLCQKSPWSSHRIMRGGDMPTAGVLPCSHVFHAECLEQLTPKTQIHEPPCPLCLKTIGPVEDSSSVSEPLHMALRSVQRSRGILLSGEREDHVNNEASNHINNRLRIAPRWNDRGSSFKNRLKRHFTFKAKASRGIFGTKMFHMIGSSSSSREPVQRQVSIG